MKSNKIEIDQLYDSFFLTQTFDSKALLDLAKQEASWVVNKNKIFSGSDILDVGCGTGRHLRAFLDQNLNCAGVDFSKSCIELAKKNCPEIANQLFEDDFINFEQRSAKKFDFVFATGATLGYSDTDHVNSLYLKSLANIVKESGFLVFDFLNLRWAEKQFKNRVSFWSEDQAHYILDDRKMAGTFLMSQKIFIDKKTSEIKKYNDKVKCYTAIELQNIIKALLPNSKVISLTDGYEDKDFSELLTPLGVLNIQN